ncbi:MAG: TolC family protein [Bacteroidales bacterium]|nr:TolC family protein [Bacteroidales bacterium]
MIKRKAFVILSFFAITFAHAGGPMSLDSCRSMAVNNCKALKIASEKKNAAYYDRKSAFTNYLPKVSLAGTYMRTEKEISLLSDDQKNSLSHLGTAVGPNVNPVIAQLTGGQVTDVSGQLDGLGTGLSDALRTDSRNLTAASVMLTQPIFMGGKIRAYNNITKYAQQIASNNYDLELQNVIVDVDETYWKIVQLRGKRRLADSYLNLVKRLDNDVQQMIQQGVATIADGLSVKVKLNEAKVTIIQIDNGLSLSKMKLCQLCGLEGDTDITIADENAEVLTVPQNNISLATETAIENRPETKSLSLATKIYEEKVKIARAEFLPHLALTGGYLMSNPSVYNGFEKKFKGNAFVGVALQVPLITWGDRYYKAKAAKAEAALARYEYDEAKEKIELQVKQCKQRLYEAGQRLKVAQDGQAEADENLKYANYGLKEGVIPLSNVLEAQTAWLSAHSACLDAQIDVTLADLYLRKSIGILK